MHTDEELLIEGLLDIVSEVKALPRSSNAPKGCRHGFRVRNDEEHLLCMVCGLVIEPYIRHDAGTLESVNWKTRRVSNNKYRHETYAKDLISGMLGTVLPIDDERHQTLLQRSQVPDLIKLLKAVLPKLLTSIQPDDICIALKKLGLGRLYKYRVFLCECVNPAFRAEYLDDSERDLLMKQFRGFARRWSTRRKEYCKYFNIKRKSLPHVPSVIRWIIVNIIKREEAARYVRRMRSDSRQAAIDKIITHVFIH